MGRPFLLDEGGHFLLENGRVKLEGVLANELGVTIIGVELVDGVADGVNGLLGEEGAGAGDDGVESAAGGVGDNGATSGHGLDGGDAEIFFAGEEEGAATGDDVG